ncbi:MAG: diadenylate cyclase CdaA [Oscillospiraceae bacterium]|nr:diadenylate cyclase CdaA [Oscillospiraceae bacterium]
MDIIDIVVVAFLIYEVMSLIHTTSTARIAKGIIVLLLLTWFTDMTHMYALNFILNNTISLGFLAIVIMFQPELRHMLEKLGGSTLRELLEPRTQIVGTEQAIKQTVKACENMSREKVGALIVFERSIPLDEYFKSGTVVDAEVSSELLRNIFFPKASLHDGAMIVRDNRIAAAGCVLPLSNNYNISSDLGTRHRAGIGMSEATDGVVVIVSEETGAISVAIGGMLKRHLAPQTLERLLNNELIPQEDDTLKASLKDTLKSGFKRLKGKGGDDHAEK